MGTTACSRAKTTGDKEFTYKQTQTTEQNQQTFIFSSDNFLKLNEKADQKKYTATNTL